MEAVTLIVGLDLSLTSTGAARVDYTRGILGPERVTVTLTRVESKPPRPPMGEQHPTLAQRSTRLRKLAGRITAQAFGADLVVVEGPAYGSGTGSVHDRAGLWWLVVGRLTGAGLNVVEVPPSSLKRYATGKGNAGKDQVLAATIDRYRHHVQVTGNDVADALILAAMGCHWTGQPIEDNLPKTHQAAVKAVRWIPTQ